MSREHPFEHDELARYARHIVLKEIGGHGQRRLKGAHVTIVGAGGIGSPALQYLAAAGIGRLTVIDDDIVDVSNLQRQTLYTVDDIGRQKVAAATTALSLLNPHVRIDSRQVRLDEANAAELIADCDVVLDGSDSFPTRLCVSDAAFRAKTPLISAAVGQFEGQIGIYRGWEGGLPCYRCFVGNDPERPDASCAEQGVVGPVTGIVGSLAALEVLRTLVPFGDDPAGRLLLLDMLSWRFRNIALPKDPGCTTCGSACLTPVE